MTQISDYEWAATFFVTGKPSLERRRRRPSCILQKNVTLIHSPPVGHTSCTMALTERENRWTIEGVTRHPG